MERFLRNKRIKNIMRYETPLILTIEEKLNLVSGNPDYFIEKHNCRQNEFGRKDFLLSYLLEHPEYTHKKGNLSCNVAKELRKGIKKLEIAWDYIQENLPSVIEDLSPKKIIEIGKLVEPVVYNLRDTRATLSFPNYIPPNPAKVPALIENMLEELKSEDLHPIEKAFFLHMRIAAIQPFTYGNKRVARLLESKILDELMLPPASIPLNQRPHYLDIFATAAAAYNGGDIKRQGPFFVFMAKMLNDSFDSLMRCVNRRSIRRYNI
jgi:hypothetical protein